MLTKVSRPLRFGIITKNWTPPLKFSYVFPHKKKICHSNYKRKNASKKNEKLLKIEKSKLSEKKQLRFEKGKSN